MIVIVLVTSLDVEENFEELSHGHAVTATIYGADMSAIRSAVDGNINEGTSLDRLVSISIAGHHGFFVARVIGCVFKVVKIGIVAIAAAIDGFNGGFAGEGQIGIDSGFFQRSLAIGSHVIFARHDSVGNLCHLTCTVVASVQGAVDGASRHLYLVAAIHIGHVAATKYIATHGAAAHDQGGQSHKFREEMIAGGIVVETYASEVAARINIPSNCDIIFDDHMGFVVRGERKAVEVEIGVAELIGIVSVVVAAMVITITAGKQVFVNGSTRSHHIGGAIHFLVVFVRYLVGCRSVELGRVQIEAGATHVTADVAAAVHSAHMAFFDFYPGAVIHIAHLASAIEVVYHHGGAVQFYVGAVLDFFFSDGECTAATVVRGICLHVACIAATIHGANATRSQGDVGHASHCRLVVAPEECAHIVDA